MGLRQVLGTGKIFAIGRVTVVVGENKFLGLEQFVDVGDALFDALHHAGKNQMSRFGVSFLLGEFVELRAIFLELRDVGLEKMEVLAVEDFEIAVEKFTGDLIAQLNLRIMGALQNLRHEPGDVALGGILRVLGRGGIGFGRRGRGAGLRERGCNGQIKNDERRKKFHVRENPLFGAKVQLGFFDGKQFDVEDQSCVGPDGAPGTFVRVGEFGGNEELVLGTDFH